ncbi:MAG TPA: hypothetical protein VJV03_13600 [Pyrinomonadaceae bacterium]|nr:hypothetical protein [Pyrinomonadaceae bacterium]
MLVTVAFISLFLFGRFYQSDFEPSSFVVAGDYFCNPQVVHPSLKVEPNSAGFDGQFYYRFALNPFTSQRIERGIEIDSPALRHQRILYPVLGWILSAGNPALVPLVMILINFVALCAMGWMGGIYAQTLRQHALWGVFLPLYPGFLFTLSRNLVEILEISLLLGSLLLVRRNKPLAATLLLVLAVLTKETALLVAMAAAIVYLFEWLKGSATEKIKWHYFVAPFIVFALWQVTLFFNWGEFPIRASGNANFGVPLYGPVNFFLDIASLDNFAEWKAFIETIFLAVFCFAVIYSLRPSIASKHEKVCWLLFTLLAVSLTRAVWSEDWTFLRASSHAYTLGAIVLIASDSKIKKVIFGLALVIWLYLFRWLCGGLL